MKDGDGNRTHVSQNSDPGALPLSYIHPVGIAGFEPAASRSQSERASNCATSRHHHTTCSSDESRTHTKQDLNLPPLPVGLQSQRPRRIPEAEAILGRPSFRHDSNVVYRSLGPACAITLQNVRRVSIR
jgi:hypothetical protein